MKVRQHFAAVSFLTSASPPFWGNTLKRGNSVQAIGEAGRLTHYKSRERWLTGAERRE